jgi:alpha-ribazole phosphatase
MDLTLIRHTKVNIEPGICYGQTDVDLAQGFRSEFEQLASKIGDTNYDLIFSSPLQRCYLLAKFLFPGKEIITDVRLMEMNFGEWEGKKWDEIFETPEGKAFFNDFANTGCPGGESYTELIIRVKEFYNELKLVHTGKNMVIITHGGPIRAFINLIKKIPQEKTFETKVDYGEMIRITNK